MIANYYGKTIPIEKIRRLSDVTKVGSNLYNLSKAAEKLGFTSMGAKVDYTTLLEQVDSPCIAYWEQKHFVVIVKVTKNYVMIADPKVSTLLKLSKAEFTDKWKLQDQAGENPFGIILILTPQKNFLTEEGQLEEDFSNMEKGTLLGFLVPYFKLYRKYLFQLLLGLLAGSLLSLILPFLTQSIVDTGIHNRNISFIYLILFGQLLLFVGRIIIELIRSWLLVHLSTRINISLISDFFLKLMRLPSSFFDSKVSGDLLQRIRDHYRIEQLITSSTLSVLFAMVNILVFSAVLFVYSFEIFILFVVFSALYIGWILIFLKRRKVLDYLEFDAVSEEQDKVLELIGGMQEIKMYNAELFKRWSWEKIQYKLFKLRVRRLTLEQYQSVGAGLINELKNILITAYAANLVISGDITLGMMLSISYITGQLNGPIAGIIGFVHALQDARIGLERILEIYDHKDEEENPEQMVRTIDSKADIILNNVHFKYPGSEHYALKNIDLIIPSNKVTAIVGASGSGKSTLLKLITKHYSPTKGEILVGSTPLSKVAFETWRDRCGTVMQESFIFNDSIERNIAVSEYIDPDRLVWAAKSAQISDTIEKLPISYKTKIGVEGVGMSVGQKQRLFIARVLYKDPHFVFLDEATSSLDANNEKTIMTELTAFFENKTIIIIAHRLSTVKNADQIIVMDEGEIIEQGVHSSLIKEKGAYYELIKNQLTLFETKDKL
jgi:ATP-binding cassette subfamily B protein